MALAKELDASLSPRSPSETPSSRWLGQENWLASTLAELYTTNQFCDITLQVSEGKTIRAHSLVLKAVGVTLPEPDENNVIRLDEYDFDFFRQLLALVYHGTLPNFPDTRSNKEFLESCQKHQVHSLWLKVNQDQSKGGSSQNCQQTNKLGKESTLIKRKRFVCKQCRVVLNSSRQSSKHKMKSANSRKWSCNSCSKTYASDCESFVHSAKCVGHSTFTCSKCSKKFKNKRGMLSHNCDIKPSALQQSRPQRPSPPAVTASTKVTTKQPLQSSLKNVEDPAAKPSSIVSTSLALNTLPLPSPPVRNASVVPPPLVALPVPTPPPVRITTRLASVEDRLNNQKLTIGWDMDDVPLIPPDILMEEDDENAISAVAGFNLFGLTVEPTVGYPAASDILTTALEAAEVLKKQTGKNRCGTAVPRFVNFTVFTIGFGLTSQSNNLNRSSNLGYFYYGLMLIEADPVRGA